MQFPQNLDRTEQLAAALQQALAVQGRQLAGKVPNAPGDSHLEVFPDAGLAHSHVRIRGTGLLARIPKQSQLGLQAQANIDYQSTCFGRAGASGHTPGLHSVLPPSAWLPRGALLVTEIAGRMAQLPHDLPALTRALAAIHTLPLPDTQAQAPLLNPSDPLAALANEVAAQARYLPAAGLEKDALDGIQSELQGLLDACKAPRRPSRHLIAFDAHPGNFLVEPGGRAVLVDLEKCRYSYPGLDLAHLTLYTSTTWPQGAGAGLTAEAILNSYRHWEHEAGSSMVESARAWHGPLRRAMWLWSITWCAKWRVMSGQAKAHPSSGEDWSSENSDGSLVDHVRDRVDHYLSANIVNRMRHEFDVLEREWLA